MEKEISINMTWDIWLISVFLILHKQGVYLKTLLEVCTRGFSTLALSGFQIMFGLRQWLPWPP